MNLSYHQTRKQELKKPTLDKADMQGLIVRGYKTLTAATFILLKITNKVAARKYIRYLAENYITTGEKPNGRDNRHNNDPEKAVNIAFTNTGIASLANENILESFSREFKEGMSFSNGNEGAHEAAERTMMLGDLGLNHPDRWHWGSQEKPVDCVLMVYAKNKKALNDLIKEVFTDQQQGVEIVYVAGTYEYNPRNTKEHFGFMDGISQPIIKGLSKENMVADKQTLINPGEFILGYRNEYKHFSPSPCIEDKKDISGLEPHRVFSDQKDLGRNGTYLVFRQIEQHVEKFWDHLYKHSKEAAASRTEMAVKLGAKMIGRWPDGRPLVQAPSAACPVSDPTLNNFNYAETDKYGVQCPLGAHIRRTNPRDHVHAGRGIEDSLEMSKKHRMLRRGRIYGEPLDKDFDIDNMIHCKQVIQQNGSNTATTPVTTNAFKENENAVRGLHFICLVSDIARQFEFVQNVWANTSTFGGLCNEVDPVISPRPTKDQPHCHEFTTPQEIIRNRYLNVPEFTTVVGGAYFFMPGIKALKFIVTHEADSFMKPTSQHMIPEEMTSGCPMANINEVSHKVIVYLRGILKKKYDNKMPKRVFHTKTIGLVKATVQVANNLPPELQIGLFKEPKTYDAWIRFTNGSSGISPDKNSGIRGMAIKVLNVPGSSSTDNYNEAPTQDIVLSTSPIFAPGTGALQLHAVKLVLGTWYEKAVSGVKLLFSCFRGASAFIRSFVITPNVLEELYYSGTPYLFGEKNAIKWHAKPLKTITNTMPGKHDKNFLRKRLIKDLGKHSKEDIAFALFVQFQTNKITEPIDDATIPWKTPFYQVATITVPKQEIDTDEIKEMDETISFCPGNAMPEHAPLGSVNMVRKKVYEQLAKERKQHLQSKHINFQKIG
ncbi:MAG TPA: hypothetical protein VF008_03450 [Niastella sp.]